MTDKPPSAWQIQEALRIWKIGQEHLLSDPDLGDDENSFQTFPASEDIDVIKSRLIDGIINAEGMAELAAKQIKALKSRKDRWEEREEHMRAMLLSIHEMTSGTRVFPQATIGIRKGTPRVVITDEKALDDRFMVVTKTPDKTEIKIALLDGEVVDGAMLTNGPPSLIIKTT